MLLQVIFLDYDGTLTRTQKLPEFAAPPQHVLDALRRLSALPNTLVYVISGRDRRNLDRWFANTDIGLGAEHGCFYKHPPGFKPQRLGHREGPVRCWLLDCSKGSLADGSPETPAGRRLDPHG